MHRLAAPDMHILFAQTALRRLLKAEQWISCVAFAVLVTVIFADVLSRELTGSGMHWARQVGVYANIFIVMAGFGLASASGAHLRPRFADGWLPVSWNAALIRLQEGVMALFCLASPQSLLRSLPRPTACRNVRWCSAWSSGRFRW